MRDVACAEVVQPSVTLFDPRPSSPTPAMVGASSDTVAVVE